MEQILLTDEEMFYIGMSLTGGGGTYADIHAVIQASAKAQIKKVIKWLDKENNFNEYGAKRRGAGLLLTIENWQAILKEIE